MDLAGLEEVDLRIRHDVRTVLPKFAILFEFAASFDRNHAPNDGYLACHVLSSSFLISTSAGDEELCAELADRIRDLVIDELRIPWPAAEEDVSTGVNVVTGRAEWVFKTSGRRVPIGELA
jgi:hypothetical protein